jgi:UDP-glucose 4-epimerase
MRVLVTGGAGFIGSHLTDRLLFEGHHVTVLDDLSSGRAENLPRHQRLSLSIGDVADPKAVGSVIEGQDAVFHLAAVASVQASVENPLATNRSNLQGTIVVLEAARRAGVGRVIYASSAAVYGDTVDLPAKESARPRPLSPYAADKLAGEHYLAHYHQQGWLSGTALRFFNIFGPRQDPSSPYSGVISIFTDRAARGEGIQIHGDGRQTRDFLFVSDLVEVLYDSLGWSREDEPDVLNVGSAKQVSLLQLLEAIELIVGRPVTRVPQPARPGDIRHSLADTRLLRNRMPVFSPRELEEGLLALFASVASPV